MGLEEGHSHLHASVSENNVYTDRKKCFTGQHEGWIIDDAKWWLSEEMTSDASWLSNRSGTSEEEARRITEEYEKQKADLSGYEGSEEAWEGEVKVSVDMVYVNMTQSTHSVAMQYRLMWIGGDCEETIL